MTAKKSPGSGKKPKVEKLELSKETVQDLTASEAEAAEGGQVYIPTRGNCTPYCYTRHAECGTNDLPCRIGTPGIGCSYTCPRLP